jgi:hypothetical protein
MAEGSINNSNYSMAMHEAKIVVSLRRDRKPDEIEKKDEIENTSSKPAGEDDQDDDANGSGVPLRRSPRRGRDAGDR